MSARATRPPQVYAAIAAMSAELAGLGIAKRQFNKEEGYAYRGIEDVMGGLAPLLARHRLCVLPRVIERVVAERQGEGGALLTSVSLRMAFDLVSARDGSSHAIEVWGEALDEGDKATAKAMSSAYKQAMVQAFCIPVAGQEDTEARSHKVTTANEPPDPVQGWEQWSADIEDMISLCETAEAIERVQATYRSEFRALSKRQPERYARIGQVVSQRKAVLAQPVTASVRQPRSNANGSGLQEPAHA